jgi:hypothetical protein
VASQLFIQTVRENHQIKGWFSGHFHLSHDYEDSITFPGGNNRGSCVFAQTGVMTARSSRDGRRHSRLVRGNANGFEVGHTATNISTATTDLLNIWTGVSTPMMMNSVGVMIAMLIMTAMMLVVIGIWLRIIMMVILIMTMRAVML